MLDFNAIGAFIRDYGIHGVLGVAVVVLWLELKASRDRCEKLLEQHSSDLLALTERINALHTK